MQEIIVYQLVSIGGGIDGTDHTDKGGKVLEAYKTRQEAEQSKVKPWCKIEPIVVDMQQAKKLAMFKLSALDKLALGLK